MFKSTANGAVAVLNVTKNTSDCWFQVQQNLTASHFPGCRDQLWHPTTAQ
uniref:Ricin B-type lectin domain-containing protein n=1 Tax=Macrostomum lignano TaxID=282301 RepID=A0A1I8GBZ4_9PLAT